MSDAAYDDDPGPRPRPIPVEAFYRIASYDIRDAPRRDVDRIFARLLAAARHREWNLNEFISAVLAELDHHRGQAGGLVDQLEVGKGPAALVEPARRAEATFARLLRQIQAKTGRTPMREPGCERQVRPTVIIRISPEIRTAAVLVAEEVHSTDYRWKVYPPDRRQRELAAIGQDAAALAEQLRPGPHRGTVNSGGCEEDLRAWAATCQEVADTIAEALAQVDWKRRGAEEGAGVSGSREESR